MPQLLRRKERRGAALIPQITANCYKARSIILHYSGLHNREHEIQGLNHGSGAQKFVHKRASGSISIAKTPIPPVKAGIGVFVTGKRW